MNIFIRLDNEEYGPFSRNEIFASLFRGDFTNNILARTEVDPEWRPLPEILLAFPSTLEPPRETPERPAVPNSGETSGFDEIPPDQETGEPIPADNESTVPIDLPEHSADFSGIIIWRDNELFGPYSWDDIFEAFFRGELTNEDRARRETEEDWHSLGELLSAETGMVFPHMDELPVRQNAIPRRPLFDFSNTRTVLVAGLVGMILGFIATCLVLTARQAPLSTMPVQQTSGIVGQQTPSRATPLPVASPAPVTAYVQATPGLKPPRTPSPPATHDQTAAVAALSTSTPRTEATASPPPLLAGKNLTIASPTARPEQKPSPPPSNLLARVREIKLPTTPRGDSAYFWVADTARKPRAILVLCLSGSASDKVVQDQAWQKFACDNQLALAAISFSSDQKLLKAGGSYFQVDKGSGNLLLSGLDRAFGKSLPIILYGRDAGGTYAANFAAWQPSMLLLWIAYTNDWRMEPPQAGAGPAMIACDQDDAKGTAAAKQLFMQGRLKDNPWTWLPLSSAWKDRRTQMDGFVRNYMSAVFSRNGRSPSIGAIWADIGLKRAMSPAEEFAQRDRASWLPDSQTFNQWLAIMGASDEIEAPTIIEKDIATRSPSQPTLKLFLRLPPGAADGSSVSGVLAYCTWENDEASIVSKLSSQTTGKPGTANALVVPFLAFAEKHNLAVLTWGTKDAWNNNLSTEELQRKKQEAFDHNFDLLADAWVRGVTDFGRETGIPQKDYLLYGISRGAQWAHRLALRKPDYFLAVHVHIPSTFDTPTPEASKPLWLLTTGEQEYGYERAQQFYHECSALGYPIIFKAIVGLGHSDVASEHALGFKFFEYALSLKDAREAWLQALNDPLLRLKTRSVPDASWLASFRAPAFYGDFLNQDCYPANQIDMIPQSLRVPLPTKELADLWNK